MNEFSARLKILRQSNNLTQTDLAKKLDVTTASVSKYELGSVVPDMEKLIRYCELFGVSMDYLVGLSDNETDTVKPIEYNSDEVELLELFKQLPDKYKYELKGYMKGIISSSN